MKDYFKKCVVFKIKTDYKLELLSKETMRLLGSTEQVVAEYKNVPKLEILDVILMHCNVVNKNYQQESKVLFTFIHDKQYGQLITISSYSLTMLKTTNKKLWFIKVSFADQSNWPFEIDGSVNITLTIGIR